MLCISCTLYFYKIRVYSGTAKDVYSNWLQFVSLQESLRIFNNNTDKNITKYTPVRYNDVSAIYFIFIYFSEINFNLKWLIS